MRATLIKALAAAAAAAGHAARRARTLPALAGAAMIAYSAGQLAGHVAVSILIGGVFLLVDSLGSRAR